MPYNTIITATGHKFHTSEKGFTVVNNHSLYLRYEKPNYSTYGVWVHKQRGINDQVTRTAGMENLPLEVLTFALGKRASRIIQACCAARKWDNPILLFCRYQAEQEANTLSQAERDSKVKNFELMKIRFEEDLVDMVNKPTPSKFESLMKLSKEFEAAARSINYTWVLQTMLETHNGEVSIPANYVIRENIKAALQQLKSARITFGQFVQTPWFKEFGQFTPTNISSTDRALKYKVNFAHNFKGKRCELIMELPSRDFEAIFGFENSYTARHETPEKYSNNFVMVVSIFSHYEKQLSDRLQVINQLEFA